MGLLLLAAVLCTAWALWFADMMLHNPHRWGRRFAAILVCFYIINAGCDFGWILDCLITH